MCNEEYEFTIRTLQMIRDVPEINQAAVDLAKVRGMNVVFETACMYTQTAPQLPLERIFGVTSFELG